MRLVVPVETRAGERRVAATPETVGKLGAAGWSVSVQAGAGVPAGYDDAAYAEKGAVVVESVPTDFEAVVRVAPPTLAEAEALPDGTILVGLLEPASNPELLRTLAERKCTAFALELLPRISRAQSMDALSSQALVAGYRAVLEAAVRLPRFFPLAMTAAGTVPPAKVFVLGAGVAGLQAIATARRLGAVVEANDVRAAAAEEVRSLGATFVDLTEGATLEASGGYAREASPQEIARQRERLTEHLAAADAVITTAAVPGRRAPVLITAEMVERMRPGTVVVDLAAESGGNCELSVPGEDVLHRGVVIFGAKNLPATMATHASALYARNISTFLLLLTKDGELVPDFDDELVAGSCLLRAGAPVHPVAEEALRA